MNDHTAAAPPAKRKRAIPNTRLIAFAVLVALGYTALTHPPFANIEHHQLGVRSNRITGSASLLDEGYAFVLPGAHVLHRFALDDSEFRLQSSADDAAALKSSEGMAMHADVRANAQGNVIALAAQPLDSWRELWVLQRSANGWKLDVVPPGDVLDVGYVEFAGWVPGTRKLLAARETRSAGRFVQRFEIIDLDRMLVDKHADKPEYLSQFYRWQDPQWKRQTVSLR